MNTLKNIVIAIIGTAVFGLAFRLGYQAERDNVVARKAAHERI